MKLINTFKSFANDESGAVTVDWVVLTAAIVGVGLAVMSVVNTRLNTAANAIGTGIDSAIQQGLEQGLGE